MSSTIHFSHILSVCVLGGSGGCLLSMPDCQCLLIIYISLITQVNSTNACGFTILCMCGDPLL